MGVLIDDLITRGVSEPYRMFTSRAEYRLLLREDNADLRLTPTGRRLGLVSDERWHAYEEKQALVGAEQSRLHGIVLRPDQLADSDRRILSNGLGEGLRREARAAELLRRPELGYQDITALAAVGSGDWRCGQTEELIEQVTLQLEVQATYHGYIERQQREIDRHSKQESLRLPDDIDYQHVTGLSHEARQRLARVRPATLGQASRLEGMTPSAISLLLIHLKKRSLRRSA